MAQYVCSVCSYTYDEEKEKLKFSELPDNWKCPLCGASKQDFIKKEAALHEEKPRTKEVASARAPKKEQDSMLTNAEMYILCTNFAKGCEKQYMAEEAALFTQIAEYYNKNSEKAKESDYSAIIEKLNADLGGNFANGFAAAAQDGDRGALRALTWSEKVSKIVSSLIARFQKEGTKFLENTKIFVCEICGFIYIGDEAPEVCPVCKVPKLKIHEVRRA